MNNTNNNMSNYSVVVTYCNNGTIRGYTVKADGRKAAMTKLMTHINFDLVAKIEIAEIVVKQDML